MPARLVVAGRIRAGVWEVDDEAGRRVYLGEDAELACELVEGDATAQLLRLPLLPDPQPTVWICEVCELVGGPYLRPGEAKHLASEHDLVHHGRAVTAAVYAGGDVA
jgi:hypothetical protein